MLERTVEATITIHSVVAMDVIFLHGVPAEPVGREFPHFVNFEIVAAHDTTDLDVRP